MVRRAVLSFCTIVFFLLCFSACGEDDSYKPVDFSKTVDAPRAAGTVAGEEELRVAVASMTSPKENFTAYQELLTYLGKKLGRDIRLVQRKTYAEINSLFAKGDLDIAFICTGPYVTGKDRYGFEKLVTPVIAGSPYYQAYLIVNIDSPYRTLEDLRGHVFAFTDPDSNTGAGVVRYWLSLTGETPESFFSEIIYTYSHDNSIRAVAESLVEGASVDGAIWDHYNRRRPEYTKQTRIIKKSEPFGAPPLVSSKKLPGPLRERIKNILVNMDSDPEGRRILNSLNIDAFRETDESCYGSARRMFDRLGDMTE